MKMKFKELPKFWQRWIVSLSIITAILAVSLGVYAWNSIGSLLIVMLG